MHIIIQDPCAVLAPGSWLWYAAGCWLPRIAVASSGMLAAAIFVAVRLRRLS